MREPVLVRMGNLARRELRGDLKRSRTLTAKWFSRCMELRHLRYFVAVADTLNFRRAAEIVHIEQSPLSQQIRNLEQELGVELFKRTKRRVTLTHAGEVFLRDAQSILAKAAEGIERARCASRGAVGTLGISYLTSMTNDFFTSVVREFRSQFPDVALSFYDLVPAAILNAVTERAADVGLLRGTFISDELAIEDLGSEPLVVAMSKDHPLAGKTTLSGSDLAKESFVMLPDEGCMGYNDAIRAFCNQNGFAPFVRAEGNQMQAVMWLVHLGLGLSLIPRSFRGLLRDDVVHRELANPPHISMKLVYRHDDDSPLVKNFLDVARSAAESVFTPVGRRPAIAVARKAVQATAVP
jgi:DNA-binding transcriptional LysR family regulator